MPTQNPLHPAHPLPAAGAPAISVVIPVFNGAEYLNRQLRSLADERLSGAVAFEVIVADNGSTDGSVGVAKAWGDRLDLRVIEESERRGQAHARNRGAAAAKTDLLLFLDQDDEVAPGYIGHMHAALEHAPFVAARMDPRPLNAGWRLHSRDLAQEHGLAGVPGSPAWAYGCSLGIRRAEFDRLGGFGEALPTRAGEDIDLCWRAAAIGIDLEFVPEAVLHYRFPSTIRGLYRQGRTYGLAGAHVDARHGLAAGDSWFTTVRGFAGPLRLALGWSRASRARGAFLLGRRVGALRGRRAGAGTRAAR